VCCLHRLRGDDEFGDRVFLCRLSFRWLVGALVFVSARPSPAELLERPGSLLTRSDLRELGLERRAVDAVFRALPTVHLEGYSRPLIRVEDYLALIAERTYDGKTAARPE
jgi:hypothetical protein